MKLKVEYIPIGDLKPYEGNAKIHTPDQIGQIKNSITEFGMNDPIAVWGEDNLIIEGHGRLMACQELGMETVPIIRLDDLTDEQRRAYTLVHNQTTMSTGFDLEMLHTELDSIDLDMSDFSFVDGGAVDWAEVEDLSEEVYEEPEKDMLECPNCHHIDSKTHFRKIKTKDDIEQVKVDNYNVRQATLEDIDAVKKIADKNSDQIGFVLRPALEEHCRKNSLLVAESNGEILGFCNYNKRQKDGVSVIYEVCTDWKYRGNGIGKALVDKVELPISLKCPVDNESNNFYEHCGFTLTGVEEGKKRKLNIWELKAK